MTERMASFPKGVEPTLKRIKEIGLKRLWKHSIINQETSCWEWHGAISHGYGNIYLNYVNFQVHRISAFLHKENFELLSDQQVNHKCNNKKCWNPEHIYVGTPGQNTRDSIIANTHFNTNKMYCPQGHEYTEENTRHYEGRRHCRQCAREGAQLKRDLYD